MSNPSDRDDRHEEPTPTDPRPQVVWQVDRCAYCRREHVPTVEVDSIHAGSGAGYAIRACRSCLPATGADPTRYGLPPAGPGAGGQESEPPADSG